MNTSVLLIVDMLSPWNYEGAESVADGAESVVETIGRLREAGRGHENMDVVYANDLAGGFHGSREKAFEIAMAGHRPDLVAPLEPVGTEEFIHKGQHSAFYGTPLAHLLEVRDVEEVILCGQVTEQCILYSALDAHVRGYRVIIPVDAVLAQDVDLGAAASRMIETNMKGMLARSDELSAIN